MASCQKESRSPFRNISAWSKTVTLCDFDMLVDCERIKRKIDVVQKAEDLNAKKQQKRESSSVIDTSVPSTQASQVGLGVSSQPKLKKPQVWKKKVGPGMFGVLYFQPMDITQPELQDTSTPFPTKPLNKPCQGPIDLQACSKQKECIEKPTWPRKDILENISRFGVKNRPEIVAKGTTPSHSNVMLRKALEAFKRLESKVKKLEEERRQIEMETGSSGKGHLESEAEK